MMMICSDPRAIRITTAARRLSRTVDIVIPEPPNAKTTYLYIRNLRCKRTRPKHIAYGVSDSFTLKV